MKSKLSKIGKRARIPIEEENTVENFMLEMQNVTKALEEVIEEVSSGVAKSPKENEEHKKQVKEARSKIGGLSSRLAEMQDIFTSQPQDPEELGKRIYNVAYPGQDLNLDNIEEFENRVSNFETNFLDVFKELSSQMDDVAKGLEDIAADIQSQGVKMDSIDEKLDIASGFVLKAEQAITEIQQKLAQNKKLIIVLGVVIVGLASALVGAKLLGG
ncbi:MAG: hypothetical protein ACFFBD_20750 [Candidatus Hodarchaeota archaeon]